MRFIANSYFHGETMITNKVAACGVIEDNCNLIPNK